MDIKDKPGRDTLKGYFVKNAIPTEANFAALIDGLINQKDDGIAKLPGQPLSLQPDQNDTGLEKVINFYKKFGDEKPAWTLSLNPQAKPGWSVGDAEGSSKLFIDESSGNVGVGTSEPRAKFHVSGRTARIGGHYATTILRIEATDNNYLPSETVRLELHGHGGRAKGIYISDVDNADKWFIGKGYGYDGVGVGYSGTGKTEYSENAKLFVGKNGNVGIGTVTPTVTLEVKGLVKCSGISVEEQSAIHVDVDGAFYRYGGQVYLTVDDNFYIRDQGGDIKFRFNTDKGIMHQQAWQTAPFVGSWKNFDGPYTKAGYFKDSQGIVHLRGLVKDGSINSTIFTLPSGYRPQYRELHGVCTNNNTIGRLDILTGGEVIATSGSSSWFSLDGVSFRAV